MYTMAFPKAIADIKVNAIPLVIDHVGFHLGFDETYVLRRFNRESEVEFIFCDCVKSNTCLPNWTAQTASQSLA